MSWNKYKTGYSDIIAMELVAEAATDTPLAEPEETLRQSAMNLIATALAANTPPRPLTVVAAGSQSQDGGTIDKPASISNTLNISIS